MKEIAIALNEQDYRCLIRGGILQINTDEIQIKIILKDIGFIEMQIALDDVQDGKEEIYERLERYN